ncbi:MAG: glycoside hydrolase family 3 protein [Velocimicrobium sp.]
MGKNIKIALILLLGVSLVACGKREETMAPTPEVTNIEPINQEPEESVKPEESIEPEVSAKPDEEVEPEKETTSDRIVTDKAQILGMAQAIRNNMTLEEKIGQLFIVNFEQLDNRKGETHDFTKVTATMREALKTYHVGGVIFFSRNSKTPEQTKKFIDKLQGFSSVPLFISVDEEGGEVARIAKNKAMNTTSFPNMSEVGAMDDEEYAYNMGKTIGKEINDLGFNLDFAPVADVRSTQLHSEIGNRSFGSDPDLVAKMVRQVVTGLQEEHVISTLKHFPGLGSTSKDTHEGAVDVDSDINELRKVSFIPFKEGIRAGADMIMVSHISISNVTGSIKPASMTELVMKDILRTELSFDGVIITDAMNMKSVTNYYTSGEAAVNAIAAGTDMILMPENFVAAYQAVYQAVVDGEIDEKTIDNNVQRILELKIKRGIILEDTPLLADKTEE